MEIIAAIVLFGAAFAAMSIGVVFRGKSLQRSCGGMGDCACGRRAGEACPRETA